MNQLINAKEHSNKLSNDKERMLAKLESIRAEVAKHRTDKTEVSAALKEYERGFVRDEVSANDLATATAKLNEISDKLAAAERLEQLAIGELQNIEREILESARHIQACHRDFCLSEKTAISTALDHDPKIRAKMLEAYAAMISNPYGYNSDWTLFISSIFSQQPTGDEISEAVAKFNQKHSLNQ